MSEQIKNGGPAFPHKLPRQDTSGVEASDFTFFGGMTLRDYFAAKAIPMAAKWEEKYPTGEHAGGTYAGIASRAYILADAMIAVRGEQS